MHLSLGQIYTVDLMYPKLRLNIGSFKVSSTIHACTLKNTTQSLQILPFYWLKHTTPLDSDHPYKATKEEKDAFEFNSDKEEVEKAVKTFLETTIKV